MSTKPDTETEKYYVTNLYDIDYLLDQNRIVVLQANRPPSVADMEAVAARLNELIQLRAWKESAMDLLSRYDSIAETFGGKLGSSKIDNLNRGVERLRKALQEIADQDTLCTCEHDTEFCCARVGHYCAFCIAATALREALAPKGE